MSVWDHIILEAHCFYSFMSQKRWVGYGLKKTSKGFDIDEKDKHVTINKEYIPKSKRPKWCINRNKKRVPQFRCLCNGKKMAKCPFFAYTNASVSDYRFLYKKYAKVK